MRNLRIFTAVLFALGLAAPPRVSAQDSAAEAREYAALEALRAALKDPAAKAYEFPTDELADLVRRHPREHYKPDPDGLKAARKEQFDNWFDEQIRKAVKGADPDGKLKLFDRVKTLVAPPGGPPTALRTDARANYEKYVNQADGGLGAAYRAARERVIDEQTAEVKKGVAAGHFPSAEDIEKARVGESERAEVTHAVEARLRGDRILLEEAEGRVKDLASAMVGSGLDQLKDQLDALKAEPTACTADGMLAEFSARLRRRAESVKPAADRTAYGVFPQARKAAEARAAACFEERVAAAARARAEQWSRPDAVTDAEARAFKEAIVKRPAAHHTMAQSQATFKPAIEDIVQRVRKEVVLSVQEAAEKRRSEYDPAGAVAALSAAVESRLAGRGPAREAWDALGTAVKEQVAARIKAVRRDVAAEQAGCCPDLVSGKWDPEEKVFTRHVAADVGRAQLKELRVWKGEAPPADEELLEEAGDDLVKKARECLARGQQALQHQRNVVAGLKDELQSDVKAAPGKGAATWAGPCAEKVLARWQKGNPSGLAERYPALFAGTLADVRAVVADALELSAKEAQNALVDRHRPAAERAIQAEATPRFKAHLERLRDAVLASWKEQRPAEARADLFPDVEERMAGIVKGAIDARAAAAAEEESRAVRERRRREEERKAAALRRQLQIVSDVYPAVEGEMKKDAEAGRERPQQYWNDTFIGRVRDLWARDDMAQGEDRDLRPEVLSAIAGKLSELFKSVKSHVRALVLGAQLRLVKKHRDGVAERVAADRAKKALAKPAVYEADCAGAVLGDWLASREHDAYGKPYGSLLRETEEQIKGVVAELVAATVGSDATAGGDAPPTTPASVEDPWGARRVAAAPAAVVNPPHDPSGAGQAAPPADGWPRWLLWAGLIAVGALLLAGRRTASGAYHRLVGGGRLGGGGPAGPLEPRVIALVWELGDTPEAQERRLTLLSRFLKRYADAEDRLRKMIGEDGE